MQITEVETWTRGRVKLRLDDGTVIALYKKEAGDIELAEGACISIEQYEKLREEILLPRAKKRAMYLLEKMDRTEYQLREKLRQGFYGEELIDAALEYVKSFHYVDDYRYACSYVNYHGQQKSSRQIKLELQRKGVPRDCIDKVLQEEYAPEGEEAMITRWLEKKHYDKEQADMKDKQKMYQFLMRKGFQSEDILRQLR